MKKKNKKSKAGRKPVADKKVRVVLFFNQSRIDDAGGMDDFKKFAYEWIGTEARKKLE